MKSEGEAAILNPEQKRIFDNLVDLIGRGTADLYYSACEIRNSNVRPRASALLVGHLFREVDSAVCAALTPPQLNKPSNKANEHAAKIDAILRVLDVTDADPKVRLWRKFANAKDPWHLVQFAHRRGLGGIRAFDRDFEDLCSEFDALLVFVLDRIRASAAKLAKKLNEILAIPSPTTSDIKMLRNHVPSAPFIFDRLFDVRLSANWIDALLTAGFFAEPPPGASVPAAMFAMRLSESDITRARNILEQLPTVDDAFMGNAYIVTINRMGRSAYPKLFEKLLVWVEGAGFAGLGPYIYPQFSKLIVHLGVCEDVDRVLALTGALTVVRPPSTTTNPYFSEPEALLNAEEYDDVLKAALDALFARDPISLVNLLSDRLETTLDIRFDPPIPSPNGNEDISGSWLGSFDDSNEHAYSIKQVLAKRLADALRRVAAADPRRVAALVQSLRARRYRVFRRLEAHLLLHVGSDAYDLADDLVCDVRNFWPISPHPEFAELLRNRFPCLDVLRKQLVLDHITVELNPSMIDEDATDDDRRELGNRRIKNYLALLSGHVLPKYDDLLARLNDALGASTDHVSQVHAATLVVGLESPRSKQEFASLSPIDLATTLFERAFDLGLAEQLREAIAGEPERFAPVLSYFQKLATRYLHYVLLGFSLALNRGHLFDWAAVIEFCHYITTHAESTAGEVALLWSGIRHDVCMLVIDGASGRFSNFGVDERPAILAIIERVLFDEPPKSDTPIEFTSVLLRSKTDTRAVALRALMGVLFLFRETGPLPNLDLRQGVRRQPDAAAILLRFLDRAEASIRVVFGEQFDALCRLDRTWAKTIVTLVFPTDTKPDDARFAAWQSFIVLCHAQYYTHDLLTEQYALAARAWPIPETKGADPDFSYATDICTHLLTLFFAYGRLSIAVDLDPLFARLPDEAVGRAMFRIARFLENFKGDRGSEHITRMMEFWTWRTTRFGSRPAQHDEEIQGFGTWYCTKKLPEAWALAALRQALIFTDGAVHLSHQIVKCLREVSDEGLANALECLVSLIEGRAATHNLYYWAEDIRVLVLRAHAVDEQLAQTSREIVGRLTAKRLVGFDDLFG